MWQALRAELHPQGVEVVTVALDTGGAEAAGPFIDAAAPEHPSLIDAEHRLDELLGITNVPDGRLDRRGGHARAAAGDRASGHERPARHDARARTRRGAAPRSVLEMLAETAKIRVKPKRYAEALRDWAANGAESEYALSPEEVIERSRPRTPESSEAAAHFALGQHLHRAGDVDAARAHFREAHRLDPDNWTYRRQAWSFEDPLQGPSEHYDSDWLSDVKKSGAANYYPLPDL